MCGPRVRIVSTIGIGSFCLAIGIIALTFVPTYIDNQVLQRDFLGYETNRNGSTVYNDMTKQWMNPPYAMTFEIYLFNITNRADIMQGAKPKVQEIGPFSFIEKQKKSVSFNEDGSRVVYRNKRTYQFNQELSCPTCDLKSKVIIPNIIFQKLVEFANKGIFYKYIIESVITVFGRETAFIDVTVEEALFKGYVDELLNKVCNKPAISSLCKAAKIPKRIGFFYGQNNTDDGSYEVNTGLGEPFNIGKVYSWNNLTEMPIKSWESEYARMINGTDGQLFPPMIKKEDTLTLFAALAGRSIWMEFLDITSYRDVPAYRFSIPSTLFDGNLNKNQIFCNKDTPQFFNESIQTPGCLPNGLIDVGRNQPGQPRVYLSQGHLLDADGALINSIVGLKPGNAEDDITYADIEPTTGVVIRARRSMQLNVAMLKGNLKVLENTNNMIVPILWMNETVLFDDGTRDQLKNQLLFAKRVSFITGVSFILVGAIVWVVLAAVLLIFTINREQSNGESLPFVQDEQEQAQEES